MIIECISDLHGHYPPLEGGDLLIVAGDLTAHDSVAEVTAFVEWIYVQDYRKIILIGGNHDNILQQIGITDMCLGNDGRLEYLQDQYTLFDGLKIWGSPWTLRFKGMNPNCMAFTCETEEELAEKWVLIPDDTDILITHSPPYGLMDLIDNLDNCGSHSVGSKSLADKVRRSRKLKLHVFGHIHEYGGQTAQLGRLTQFVNASHVNELYEPVNKPIRVIL